MNYVCSRAGDLCLLFANSLRMLVTQQWPECRWSRLHSALDRFRKLALHRLCEVSIAPHKAGHVEHSSHDTVGLPVDHDRAHMPVTQHV